ncbi:hypothetical protein BB560_006794 [Smittium megazygosporum]|uniref:Uncharacterized protein n=1 Tax=Smittium megazygosporum TaxID=133381 RepID=A0A2T9Y1L8_9FUNG|nr:hypothetical protein BB560_006794 [Smittium megazygosporum]
MSSEAVKLFSNAHKFIPSYKKAGFELYKIVANKRADLSHMISSQIEFLINEGQTELEKLSISKVKNFKRADTTFKNGAVENNLELLTCILDNRFDIEIYSDYETDCDINYFLELASDCEHPNIDKLFLDRGADVRADEDYFLRLASQEGHLGVVRLLLKRGADIHTKNEAPLRLFKRMKRDDTVEYFTKYHSR